MQHLQVLQHCGWSFPPLPQSICPHPHLTGGSAASSLRHIGWVTASTPRLPVILWFKLLHLPWCTSLCSLLHWCTVYSIPTFRMYWFITALHCHVKHSSQVSFTSIAAWTLFNKFILVAALQPVLTVMLNVLFCDSNIYAPLPVSVRTPVVSHTPFVAYFLFLLQFTDVLFLCTSYTYSQHHYLDSDAMCHFASGQHHSGFEIKQSRCEETVDFQL